MELETYLLVRHRKPHAQIQMCNDGTVKSDLSVVVLHYFGLGRTIGFQAAVSDTSGGKHLESSHHLIVRSKCLWHIVTQTRQVSGKYGAWCRVSGACRSISILETSWLPRWGRYDRLGVYDIDHLMIVNCRDNKAVNWFNSITTHWNIWWFRARTIVHLLLIYQLTYCFV